MSDLEDTLYWQIKVAGLPLPERQHKGITGRQFVFDFAWPDQKLACEVDGATFGAKCKQCGDTKAAGRHARGQGIQNDAEKVSLAVSEGWRVLRVTGQQVKSGAALRWIELALRYGQEEAG